MRRTPMIYLSAVVLAASLTSCSHGGTISVGGMDTGTDASRDQSPGRDHRADLPFFVAPDASWRDGAIPADAPSAADACAVGTTVCGGQCVDLESDALNCGECSLSCEGGACKARECQPVALAWGQDRPDTIAVAAGYVYWATHGTGVGTSVIKRVPSGGGPQGTLVTGQSYPAGLAVNATTLFWSNSTGLDAGNGALMAAPIAGGNTVVLVPDMYSASDVTVDQQNAYLLSGTYNGLVTAVTHTGSGAKALASGQGFPAKAAVWGDTVFWVNRGSSTNNGSVMSVPRAGGTPTTLVQGQLRPSGIACDGSTVYWSNSTGGTVRRVSAVGGAATTLASNQATPWALAVDGNNLYWTNRGTSPNYVDGSIMKLDLKTSALIVLAGGQYSPSAIALDDKCVYWANQQDGAIMKIAKARTPY